jgi:hypothetical protein
MQDLWRKTWELFREHWIVLWLPYACADFVNLGHEQLNRVVTRMIYNLLATHHSVLGGSYYSVPDGYAVYRQTLIASFPISITAQFVIACGYVVAFMVMTKLVETIQNEQRPDVAKALAETAPRWRDILLFSLKFCLAYGVLIGVLSEALKFLRGTILHSTDSPSKLSISLLALVVIACVTWLLIPAAFRLVRNSSAGAISVEERKLGLAFVVLGVAASHALGEAIKRAERGFTTTSNAEWTALSAMNIVLVSLPEALAFIALALLALGTKENTDAQSDSDSSALAPDSLLE